MDDPAEPKQARPHMAVGQRIQEARKAAGLKQEDVAEALSVTAITVSRWERGVFLPGIPDFVRLADAFHVSMEWMATGEGVRERAAPEPHAA